MNNNNSNNNNNKNREWDNTYTLMGIYTKDIGLMIEKMGRESILQ
jgi:hypothetical protein